MSLRRLPRAPFAWHGYLGFLLVALGEAMILARLRPVSDFYFPVVWLGYILVLDAAILATTNRSLFAHARAVFFAMLPISIGVWWLFEFFNLFVHNWEYVGGEAYTGVGFVTFASLDFSFVLLAVWTAAHFVDAMLPRGKKATHDGVVPGWLLQLMLLCGVACLVLPAAFPRVAFGLVWGSMYFLLDPINHRLGRPSIIGAVWRREWRVPVSFALGSLMCGFFWEAWNYWSLPKWVYTIPYVDHWRIFEMPLLGWTGYLPFGLELFAMTNFVLPLLRLGTLSLEVPEPKDPAMSMEQLAS